MPAWEHMAESESKISDNYITTPQLALYDQYEKYIFNWQEQCAKPTTLASSDHHGKRTARLRQDGVKLLNWSYEEFNAIGQSIIHVLVNTTPYNDATLISAYDARVRAAILWNHPVCRRLYVDNPHKDGNLAIANKWPDGPGRFHRPRLEFSGELLVVRTHDECKHAIARLESTPQGVFGFDTERVAYIREHASQGATSDKAAIAQIASSVVAVIFILHEWPICYLEFKQFMESSAFKKAAVCIRQDATALRNRFPHITPDGCVEILQRARRAFPELPNHKVGTLSRELLGRSMDKRMDHRFWEARWYTARQLRYAKLDAVAHRMIELVVSIKEGGGAAAAAAPPAPSTGDGGVPDLYEASDDEFDDPGLPQTNEACTRHRTATPADDAIIDDDCLIPGDTAADEPTVDEPTATTDGPTDEDAVEPCLLKRCKDVIDAFAADPSSGTYIALPSSLSVAERKQLHHYADQWGLHHRSATRDGQRQLMILRWLPFAPVTAAIARAALGSTVMMSPVSTENNPAIAPAPVRGVVVNFDPSNTNGPS